MTIKTFHARVVGGQLLHHESLALFEGKTVSVGVEPLPDDPDGLEIEREVYVQMPVESERLEGVRVVDGGEGEPCLIVPEELPDD